jgi:hypothetical protein
VNWVCGPFREQVITISTPITALRSSSSSPRYLVVGEQPVICRATRANAAAAQHSMTPTTKAAPAPIQVQGPFCITAPDASPFSEPQNATSQKWSVVRNH